MRGRAVRMCGGGGVRVAALRVCRTARRSYQDLRRGHDVQTPSLFALLGVSGDTAADELRRSYDAAVRALDADATRSTADKATALARVAAAYAALRQDCFRARYRAHTCPSNDAQLHVLQDGGDAGAQYNPAQQTLSFGDHAAVRATAWCDTDGSGSSSSSGIGVLNDGGAAFRAATGQRTASRDARAHSAAEERAPQNGAAIHVTLRLPFETALHESVHDIRVEKDTHCARCRGSGTVTTATPRKCPQCAGRGRVRLPSATYLVERVCLYCAGDGNAPPPLCGACAGRGLQPQRRVSVVPVRIPAHGATPSTTATFRLPRCGHDGVRGGDAGDVVVTVLVCEHRHFHRTNDGALHAMLPLPLSMALLGGVVTVPTLAGRAALNVPSCAYNGQVLTLRTHSRHRSSSSSSSDSDNDAANEKDGDVVTLCFHVLVLVPRADKLTGRQRGALRVYDEATACVTADESGGADDNDDNDEDEARVRVRRCAALKQRYAHWLSDL